MVALVGTKSGKQRLATHGSRPIGLGNFAIGEATPEALDGQPRLRLRAGSRCVRGGFRETNEDKSYADVEHGIFLVADGMGGYRGGSEASGLIVQTAPLILRRIMESGQVDLPAMQTAVEQSIEATRCEMIRLSNQDPSYNRMGATAALVAVLGNVAYLANVGDCRVYHARNGKLRQLTTDQSFVQALIEAGLLTKSEARTSPYRHIVTNSVAVKEPEEGVVVRKIELRPGDRLLLTTDGLTGSLDDDAIERMIDDGSPREVADELTLEALRRGSRDNIGCVVVKVLPYQLGAGS